MTYSVDINRHEGLFEDNFGKTEYKPRFHSFIYLFIGCEYEVTSPA